MRGAVNQKVRMFVNGQAMRGYPLHVALEGSTFCGVARTGPHYRFLSVGGRFPGLTPVSENGVCISGELYIVSYHVLREQLLPNEPPELELGVIRLSDGSGSLCMLMRSWALLAPGTEDISALGSWRRYLEGHARRPTERPRELQEGDPSDG